MNAKLYQSLYNLRVKNHETLSAWRYEQMKKYAIAVTENEPELAQPVRAFGESSLYFPFVSSGGVSPEEVVDGIDISSYQENQWHPIDWVKVGAVQPPATNGIKGKVNFGFSKKSEGTNYPYPQEVYARQMDGFSTQNIPSSGYHFWIYGLPGDLQATNFLRNYTPGLLPPVLDVEDTRLPANPTPAQRNAAITSIWLWLQKVKAITGQNAIIYTGAWYWNSRLGIVSEISSAHDLWVADYYSAVSPLMVKGWLKWLFWQYTSSGTVNGIYFRTDLNRFNGTMSEFKKYLGITEPTTVPLCEWAQQADAFLRQQGFNGNPPAPCS